MLTNNLKEILDDKKIPVARLAKAIGVTRQYIYHFENLKAKGSYNIGKVCAICNYLGIDINGENSNGSIGLLNFIGPQLHFRLIKPYTKIINNDGTIENDGTIWLHSTLNAINTQSFSAHKEIGAFGINARITPIHEQIRFDYQISTTMLPPISKNYAFKDINKEYLKDFMKNKNNLINSALAVINNDSILNFIITHVINHEFPNNPYRNIIMRPVYSNDYAFFGSGNDMILSPNPVRLTFSFNINKNDENRYHIRYSNIHQPEIENYRFAECNKNNKYDLKLFGAIPQSELNNMIFQHIKNKKFNEPNK